ncbi:uncharacterized protein [Haliotis cracherodii]|uniref:uncharacterized protein n=1 Tax=Haliotis cracherodii TaxID=6455 RepID=UPI0039EBE406
MAPQFAVQSCITWAHQKPMIGIFSKNYYFQVIHYKGRAPQKSRKIPHSSSRFRSIRKTESEKVETYLQRRRHNKKMSPCKFNVGMIVEALRRMAFGIKPKYYRSKRRM